MPTFLTQALAWIAAIFPTLLAIGTATTLINQIVQRLSFMPARVKNIVQTVTVDYLNLLAEVGGALGVGPRAKPPELP